MATSHVPVPTMSMTRGVPFTPSNGVAARTHKAEIDAKIEAAQRQAAEEARKYSRTQRTGKAWGSR